MRRDELLDKLKLAFFILVFFIGPLIFFSVMDDGTRLHVEEVEKFDFIRR